jgi:hypothetical protein
MLDSHRPLICRLQYAEYRIQNTAAAKLYLFFFIWRLALLILMVANKFRRPLEGVGPENQDFLGPEMATSVTGTLIVKAELGGGLCEVGEYFLFCNHF